LDPIGLAIEECVTTISEEMVAVVSGYAVAPSGGGSVLSAQRQLGVTTPEYRIWEDVTFRTALPLLPVEGLQAALAAGFEAANEQCSQYVATSPPSSTTAPRIQAPQDGAAGDCYVEVTGLVTTALQSPVIDDAGIYQAMMQLGQVSVEYQVFRDVLSLAIDLMNSQGRAKAVQFSETEAARRCSSAYPKFSPGSGPSTTTSPRGPADIPPATLPATTTTVVPRIQDAVAPWCNDPDEMKVREAIDAIECQIAEWRDGLRDIIAVDQNGSSVPVSYEGTAEPRICQLVVDAPSYPLRDPAGAVAPVPRLECSYGIGGNRVLRLYAVDGGSLGAVAYAARVS
jgi:hypothetical protein